MLWEIKAIAQSVRLVGNAHMKMIDLKKKTPRVCANWKNNPMSDGRQGIIRPIAPSRE